MSLSSEKTPQGGYAYIRSRLATDHECRAVSESPLHPTSERDARVLAAIYPFVEEQNGIRTLAGTAVSVGDGFFLTARHAIPAQIRAKAGIHAPGSIKIGVLGGENPQLVNDQVIELEYLPISFGEQVDLALLRTRNRQQINLLTSVLLPAFAPSSVQNILKHSVQDRGQCALFVGYGYIHELPISSRLQKNDIVTSICTNTYRDRILNNVILNGAIDGTLQSKIEGAFDTLLLTRESKTRYPHWNDSGGALLAIHDGAVFLVGIHYKVSVIGTPPAMHYPLYVNMLTVGVKVAAAIHESSPSTPAARN